MRIVSLLVVLVSFSVVWAQEGEGKQGNQPQEWQGIPTTLGEAHAELERIFSSEELAKIDAMQSEDEMIRYHMPFGTGLRNSWGLWRGSPLAKHMQELGFTHPDDMSGVILETFWCKRHGKALRLAERAAASKKSMETARTIEQEKESRIQKSNAAIQNMMMGLRFEKRDVPVVWPQVEYGMSVRFMSPFRGGVFFTGYRNGRMMARGPVRMSADLTETMTGESRRMPEIDDTVARGFCVGPDGELRKMKPGDDFYIQAFHFDLTERAIRRIRVEEVNEVYAAVVVGGRAWFAGLTEGKPALVGVGDRDRVAVALPHDDEIPDLGLEGQSLLAVYSQTIYRLTDREWTLVHSGDVLLPRSGLPPQRHGNLVFLREEGTNEERPRLWWLAMGEPLRLRLLARDTGLFDPVVQHGPDWRIIDLIGPGGWDQTSSYCVTSKGDLWACVANGSFLLRRSKDGNYAVAIMNNSVRYREESPDPSQTDQRVSVSAVTALPDDTLLLAGGTGLYRLKGDELIQELAFGGTNFRPSAVLMLDDRSYVIGTTMRDGVYLLHKGNDGQWNCLYVDHTRETVVW